MIKKFLSVLLFTLFIVNTAQSETLDEIISKVSERMGTEKFAKLPSWKIVGIYKLPGSVMDFKFYYKEKEKLRLEISLGSNQIIMVTNNDEGYVLMNGVRVGLQKQHKKLIQSIRATVKNPLLDFIDNGYEIKLKGQADFKGLNVYKIVVEKKSENYIGTFMVDSKEFLPVGMMYTIYQGKGISMSGSSAFLNYREISGMMIAFQIINEAAGNKAEFEILQMSTHLELDDKLFE